MPKRRGARGRGRGGKSNTVASTKEVESNTSTTSESTDKKEDENVEGKKEIEESSGSPQIEKDEEVSKSVIESSKEAEGTEEPIVISEGKDDDTKDDQAICTESAAVAVISPKLSEKDDIVVSELLEEEETVSSTSCTASAHDSIPNKSDPLSAVTKEDESTKQGEKESQNDANEKERKSVNLDDTLDSKGSCEQVEEVEEMFEDDEVDDDVQYIDEEIKEADEEIEEVDEEGDQDLLDVMEMGDKENVNRSQKKEVTRELKTVVQRSSSMSNQETKSKQDGKEDLANTTFEEISEGSMDPMEQEEVIIEAISDNEMILESSSQDAEEEKEISGRLERNRSSSPIPIDDDEDETLADIFEVTANDDHNVAVQDNDDISDTSLCADDEDDDKNNLSLEEISDDDLESSKRKNLDACSQPAKSDGQEQEKSPGDDAVVIVNDDVDDETIAQDANKTEDTNTHSHDDGIESLSSKQQKLSDGGENVDQNQGTSEKATDTDKEKSQQQIAVPTQPSTEESNTKSKTQQKIAVPSQQSTGESRAKTSQESISAPVSTSKSRDFSSQTHAHWKWNDYVMTPISKCTSTDDVSIQTNPIGKRGKIVQCSISRVGSGGLTSVIKEDPNATVKDKVSAIFDKYKSHLPSSVEDIFSEVASTRVPNNGTYSLSLGPVTSADFGNDQFRDICLNSAEKFTINFNSKMHGLLQAQFSKHKDVNRVIHNLKCLDLGIRYMILSVVYRANQEDPSQDWHALLIFTYNQDESQMKEWGDARDGKVRSRLAVTGVPDNISKDFVQLLFPEALYISSGLSGENGRVLTLGFSSTKTTKDISSCYELLLFNGTKVEVASMDTVISETVEDTKASGFVEEDGTVIVQDSNEEEETIAACEDAGEETSTAMELAPNENDKTNSIDKQKDHVDGISGGKNEVDESNLETTEDGINKEAEKDSCAEENELLSKDSDKADGKEEEKTQIGLDNDENVNELMSNTKDVELESCAHTDENLASEDVGVNEKKNISEQMEVEVAGTDESETGRGTEELPHESKNKKSSEALCDDKTQEKLVVEVAGKDELGMEIEAGEKLSQKGENEKSSEALAVDLTGDSLKESDGEASNVRPSQKDDEKRENLGVDVSQGGDLQFDNSAERETVSEEVGKKDSERNEDVETDGSSEVIGKKKTTGDSIEMHKAVENKEVNEAASDDKINEKEQMGQDEQQQQQSQQPNKNKERKTKEGDKDANLEDVSDDEMVGAETRKAAEPEEEDEDDDVIILKEEPCKTVVANIDLTVDDQESPNKKDKDNVEEKEIKKEVKLEELVDEDKLTMTDEGFEIQLESIDVEEEEEEYKTVIQYSGRGNFGEYRGKYYNSNLKRDIAMTYYRNQTLGNIQPKQVIIPIQPRPPPVNMQQRPPFINMQQRPPFINMQQRPPMNNPQRPPMNNPQRPPMKNPNKQQRQFPKDQQRQPMNNQQRQPPQQNPGNVRDKNYSRWEPQPPSSLPNRGQHHDREQSPPDYSYNRAYGNPESEARTSSQRNYEKMSSTHSGSSLDDKYADPKSTTRHPIPSKEATASRRDLSKRDYKRSRSPSPRREVVSDRATDLSYHHSNLSYSASAANNKQQSYSNYSSTTSRSYKNPYRDHRAGDSPPAGRQSHQPSSSSYHDYKNARPTEEYNTASRSRQGSNSKYETSSSWREEYHSPQGQKTSASALPTQPRRGDKSHSFSPLSVSSSELLEASPPAKKSRRVLHSPISASSRSLSPISKSPSPPLEIYRSKDKYNASNKYRSPPPKAYRDKYSPISSRGLDTGRISSGQRRSRSRSPYKSWDRERNAKRSRSPQYRRRSPSPVRERIHQGSDKRTMGAPSSSSFRPSQVESSRNRSCTSTDITSSLKKYESLIKTLYENKRSDYKKASTGAAALSSSAAAKSSTSHHGKQKQGEVGGSSNTNKSIYSQSNAPYGQASSTSAHGYNTVPLSSNTATTPQQQGQSHMLSQNYAAPSQSAAAAANYLPQSSMFYSNPAMYNQYNMGGAGGMNPAAFQAYNQQQQQQQQQAMMYSFIQSASAVVTTPTNTTNNAYAAYTNAQQQMMHRQQATANTRGGGNVPSSANPNSSGKQSQGKHWSMGDGGNALMFQRILSSSNKGSKK